MKKLKAISLFFAGCLFAFSIEFLFVQIRAINDTNYNTSILACVIMLTALMTYILMEKDYDLKELYRAIEAIDERQEQIKNEAFDQFATKKYDKLYSEYNELRKHRVGIQFEISKLRKELGNKLKGI